MSPRIAEAVDPIFLRVFDLLDRIDAQDLVVVSEEFRLLEAVFADADRFMARNNIEWEHVKYAIATWIDEMLIQAYDWPGKEEYKKKRMEVRLFDTMNASFDFFKRAQRAADDLQPDAVEAFYLSAMMGFQGIYAEAEGTPGEGFPRDTQTWIDQFAKLVQDARQRTRPSEEVMRRGSDYLTATPGIDLRWAFWPWTLGAVLIGLNFLFFYWK